jgi:1-deoxy-D-xylulose-5-phosphate synthase
MAYEAMNNACASKTKIIVILNDMTCQLQNQWVAMRTYLAKLFTGKIYFSLRETIKLTYFCIFKKIQCKSR